MVWVPSAVSTTEVPSCGAPPSTRYCVDATPDSASCGLSVTWTPPLVQPPGAEASVVGAVLSMSTGALVALEVLPARSRTVAETVWPLPSVASTASAGLSPARPDSVSAATQTSVTSVLYQPFALGSVVGAALRSGAVSSTLIPVTLASVVLSALSVAVPRTSWSAPSPTCCGAVTWSMPDSASWASKATVTSSSYHPVALAAGSGGRAGGG